MRPEKVIDGLVVILQPLEGGGEAGKKQLTPKTLKIILESADGIALEIIWLVEDAGVKQLLGRDTVTVKQGIMLDLNASGGLDLSKGKNVGLGRLREAVGKNEEGQPFAFSMLPGLSAKIAVSHRVNGEETYSEVKGVAKL